jgi:hypothetical protein
VVVAAGAGAVLVAAGAGAVLVAAGAGAVLVAAGAGAVLVAAGARAVLVAAGARAVLVVPVGAAVGVVTPLATVNFARRLEVVPSDHVRTTVMPCDPSASLFVSYGTAVPSAAVPAKSKGGSVSVRTGGFVRRRLSR